MLDVNSCSKASPSDIGNIYLLKKKKKTSQNTAYCPFCESIVYSGSQRENRLPSTKTTRKLLLCIGSDSPQEFHW